MRYGAARKADYDTSHPTFPTHVLRVHRRHQAAGRDKAGKHWKENGLIFPSTVGTHMEPRALNTHLMRLGQSTGLPHLEPRALRQATMAYALGVGWKQLQAMRGHTILSTTTDIYVSMIEDVNRDAASKIDGWFPADEEGEDDG